MNNCRKQIECIPDNFFIKFLKEYLSKYSSIMQQEILMYEKIPKNKNQYPYQFDVGLTVSFSKLIGDRLRSCEDLSVYGFHSYVLNCYDDVDIDDITFNIKWED